MFRTTNLNERSGEEKKCLVCEKVATFYVKENECPAPLGPPFIGRA